MNHPFDLADLIAGDHRLANILFEPLEGGEGHRQVLVDQMILNVAVHAGGEEQVFYPAQTEAGWSDVVEANLAAHQVVKDALVVLDRHDAGTPEAEAAIAEIIATVRAHAADEELDELPQLRAKVGDAEMVELGRAFMAAQAKAPTRPHPHAPSNPIVAAPAALLDKLRDKSGKRDAMVATDASGLLDAQTQELVDTFAGLGVKPPHLLDADGARKQPTLTDAVKALMKKRHIDGPEPVDAVEDITLPGPGGDIAARTYRPSSAPEGDVLPVLVYVHGGGWVIADLDVYDASCRGLANRSGALVVSVEYRHAPEHPFPAAHDDVLAATTWIMANAASLGGDPTRVAIAGESAGGNMAAATCIALAAQGASIPVFQLLVYPVTSTAMDTPSYADAADAKPLYSGFMNWFFGQAISSASDLADPRLNLLSVPASALTGLPPTLVITASRDPLRDEGEAFSELLRDAGVEVEAMRFEGVCHEFFGAAAVLDQAARAQDEAAQRLQVAFGASATAAAPVA